MSQSVTVQESLPGRSLSQLAADLRRFFEEQPRLNGTTSPSGYPHPITLDEIVRIGEVGEVKMMEDLAAWRIQLQSSTLDLAKLYADAAAARYAVENDPELADTVRWLEEDDVEGDSSAVVPVTASKPSEQPTFPSAFYAPLL